MSKTMLSAHFSADEMKCSHCGQCSVNARLLVALEELRTAIGKPLKILSGYRCSAHNAEVGGATKSEHANGNAADVTWADFDTKAAYAYAQKVDGFNNGGIGLYKQEKFIHVDVRGKKARWARIDGKYVDIKLALT